MQRLFATHHIRRNLPLPALWTLTTLDEGGLDASTLTLVPGVWESIPKLHRYQGRAVYETQFTASGHVRLSFGGVSFRARVMLDDQELCTHYGAYTAFDAVAQNLPEGLHTLRVEVDNRFGEDSALHVPNDYYSYGGINRPVVAQQLGPAYITQLHVTPVLENGQWQARMKATLRSLSDQDAAYTLCLAVEGFAPAELPVTLSAHEEITLEQTIACPGAKAWNPGAAALYGASAVLMQDGMTTDDLLDRFGFREVKVCGTDILFNGEKLRLKGFNRHEEYGPFGCSVPVDAMLHDIQLMLDLGCNCVRTCHYPNDPRFLDLCDEMGLLVWEESHARGLSEEQMRHPRFMEQNLLCTREMVAQHYNHPSIFIWGCLNECADDCEYGADCYRQTYRLLDELDESRPMTAALLEREGGLVFGDSDVVSVNMYPQWYLNDPVRDHLAEKVRSIHERGGAGKPLIISEIGAGAIYGYHDPFGESKWSEERQCTILKEQIEAVLSSPDCSGIFLWQFADVRVDESWMMSRPRTHNNKGVVDEYRRPKLSYKLVKELFHRG